MRDKLSRVTSYIGNDSERLLRIAKYATKKMNGKNRSSKRNNRKLNNNSKGKNVSKRKNGKSKLGNAKSSSNPSSTSNNFNRPFGNMRYYTPASIKSSTIIGTVCLYGNLKDILLKNHKLVLDIIRDDSSVKVNSAPDFFKGQSELYSDLQSVNKLFKEKIIKNDKTVQFTGDVDIDVRPTGKRYIVANKPKFLRFPTESMATFIYNLNHRK